MAKNVIIGQSGGPTAVINSSLAGVYKAACSLGADKVYGMKYGIEGLLKEEMLELNVLLDDRMSIELLKRTPSSYLGSCRYKLPDPDVDSTPFIKLFTLFDKYDICAVFYIGGNDSMDTIAKLSRYGDRVGSSVRFIGVPKTIDNDLVQAVFQRDLRVPLVALELVHPQKALVVVAGVVLQRKPHPLALQAFADGSVCGLPVPALVVVLKVEFDLSGTVIEGRPLRHGLTVIQRTVSARYSHKLCPLNGRRDHRPGGRDQFPIIPGVDVVIVYIYNKRMVHGASSLGVQVSDGRLNGIPRLACRAKVCRL